jgi:hypothetical protein
MKMYFTKMLTVCCAIVFGVFLTTEAKAQGCENTAQWPISAIDMSAAGSALTTISTCIYLEEYSMVTGVPVGEDVQFSLPGGGYVTVREASSSGPVVAQGLGSATVIGTSGADLYPHWSADGTCATSSGVCVTSTVQCVSCASDCPEGNFGDACNDLDPATVGDVIGLDCVCAGVLPTGDCLNVASFGAADLALTGPDLVTIAGCSFMTEYSTVTGATPGSDLEFTIVEGGYITVRSGSFDGAIVAQGASPLTVSGASGADLYPHWNLDGACAQAEVCVTTQVQCTSCDAVCPNGNIGDACDDGNPATIGSTIQEDCSCGGGFVPIADDNCEDISFLLVCGGSVDGTTVGTTATAGLNNICNDFETAEPEDAWYAFSADGSSSYTVAVDTNVATSSSLMDAVMFVYSGECGALTEVACADSNFTGGTFSGESITLDTPAAGTYYVRVFNWNPGGELFTISLECEENNNCSNPFPAVDEGSLSTTLTGGAAVTAWSPVPNQIGCQIQVRLAGGATLGAVIVGGAGASGFNIPFSALQPGTDYEWRVRCGCSQTPLVAGAFSSYQPFSTPGGAVISSLPNPTTGQSNVTFSVADGGYATLDVYDMSGRLVDAIFTGAAQANKEYRFDFDGSALPNGVYIYRLTTLNEVVNEKFIISR